MDHSATSTTDPLDWIELVTRKPLYPPQISEKLELSRLQEYIAEKEQRLSEAPEGTLVIAASRKSSFAPEYYLSLEGQRTYLSSERPDLIKSLAQKEYDQKQLKEARRLEAKLSRFAGDSLTFHETYGTLRQERQALVEPDFLPDEHVREQWGELQYEHPGFPANYPEYFADNGLRVRSIGEKKIANRLLERGVLFLYEFPFQTQDGRPVYPDFTCLNLRTRELFLWEHLGRLDDMKYYENNLRKFDRYRSAGYYVGVNLIVTYELSGVFLKEEEVDLLIDRFLL